MSTTPNIPEPPKANNYQTAATPRWVFVVFGIVFLLLGYLHYAGHTARTSLESELANGNNRTNQLIARMDQTNSRLADLKGQLDVTSQKLGLTA